MEYRIAVLSLSGSKPVLGIGAASNSSLHIIDIKAPPANLELLKAYIEKALINFKQKEITLFVDDPTNLLSDYGYRISLSDMHNGKLILATSLNRYLAMNASGAITWPNNTHGIEIHASMLNERTNDKGESTYQVDWSRLKDNARLALLMLHAGFSQELHHQSFSKDFFAALSQQEDNRDNLSHFANTLRNANKPEYDNSFREEMARQGRKLL